MSSYPEPELLAFIEAVRALTGVVISQNSAAIELDALKVKYAPEERAA